MKIRGVLLFAAGILLGGLVVPVAAQGDPAENQLVIRSDGFIFLLRSGQRHLVSPVALTDEEINGYPEGEPYLSGLIPVEATTASPAGTFSGSTQGTSTPTTSRSTPGTTSGVGSSSGTSAGTGTSTGIGSSSGTGSSTAVAKPDASSPAFEAGFKTIPENVAVNSRLQVVVTAPDGSNCEGKIQYKGGKTTPFAPGRTSNGECRMELTIPSDARVGDADVKAVVKSGTQIVEFEEIVEVVARR
jgi:hypothetical protein